MSTVLPVTIALGICVLPAPPAHAYPPWKSESHSDTRTANRFASGSAWLAQTFTTINYAHNAVSVRLHLCRWGYPGTLTVSIRATVGDGYPAGADLATGITDGNTLPGMNYGCAFEWREVALSPAANLTASTTYAIVLRATGGDADNNYVMWSSTYPTGSGLRDSSDGGLTWDSHYFFGDTAGFEVWSSTQPPNQVPQLSSPMVIPDTGLTTADIYYYVHYYDPDAAPGDVPGVKTVMIDYVNYTMSLLSGTASDGNYVYGPVRLPYSWIHRYSFHFEDARGGTACSPSSCSGFYVGPYVTIPLGDALDNTALTWTTGGNAAWFGQSDTTHDGTDAARSGTITDEQATWLQTTAYGPGTLTFWWKVSSEASYDFLTFDAGGGQQAQISGEVGWEQRSYSLTWGPHTLQWEYRKDRDLHSGEDFGWVDAVAFTPTPPPTVTQVTPARGLTAGGSAITITGTNFVHWATVTIGGAAATAVTVVSTTMITATTPAGVPGPATVTVTTPVGSASLTGGFTYVPVMFTDDPLQAGTTPVKAIHIMELRTRIDVQRTRYGLNPFVWTDSPIVPGVTPVAATHLTQLRAALQEAYVAAGKTPLPTYTDVVITAGMTLKAVHIAELRSAVIALE